jgi:uncharacterized protein (DUF952 family)
MTQPTLFHIVEKSRWDHALAVGRYAPESLASEGFVHCSYAAQVEPVANALYRDASDLVVVGLDGALLDVPVVVEDTYASGTSYPHVYGPISVRAQIGEQVLIRRADGGWTFAG